MERYTKPGTIDGEYECNVKYTDVVNKLAMYENLGYTPEEIDDMAVTITDLEAQLANEKHEQPETREEILKAAEICICGHRQVDYGKPEDSFGLIAKFWSIYKGVEFTAIDVAEMMVLLKVARVAGGTGSIDSFVDQAGYSGCGGEIYARNNKDK